MKSSWVKPNQRSVVAVRGFFTRNYKKNRLTESKAGEEQQNVGGNYSNGKIIVTDDIKNNFSE